MPVNFVCDFFGNVGLTYNFSNSEILRLEYFFLQFYFSCYSKLTPGKLCQVLRIGVGICLTVFFQFDFCSVFEEKFYDNIQLSG